MSAIWLRLKLSRQMRLSRFRATALPAALTEIAKPSRAWGSPLGKLRTTNSGPLFRCPWVRTAAYWPARVNRYALGKAAQGLGQALNQTVRR